MTTITNERLAKKLALIKILDEALTQARYLTAQISCISSYLDKGQGKATAQGRAAAA